MNQNQEIELKRDCEAIQIPAGLKTTIPAGTKVIITQGTNTQSPTVRHDDQGAYVLYQQTPNSTNALLKSNP